jgi:hypothetical protein
MAKTTRAYCYCLETRIALDPPATNVIPLVVFETMNGFHVRKWAAVPNLQEPRPNRRKAL